MSIIEQAAKRLESLRQSGIDVPSQAPAAAPAASPPPAESLLVRATRRLEEARRPEPAVVSDRHRPPVHERPALHEISSRDEPPAPARTVKIDMERLAAMGYLTPYAPRSQVATDFRVVKRQLLTNVADPAIRQGNLVMVTSSVPGEGKTFVAINLAMSMAMEVDKRVLLVDADVARPAVLPRLGIEPTTGFLDLLADPTLPISNLLLRTNVEKLSILPAGAPREHATEMLASDSMNRLMHELSSRYPDRVIVFDAPPLLPSTESRVLASRMGQVILVVEAQQTPQKVVEQALATIEACPLVLPLLNKASRSEMGHYYGYGYYGMERG